MINGRPCRIYSQKDKGTSDQVRNRRQQFVHRGPSTTDDKKPVPLNRSKLLTYTSLGALGWRRATTHESRRQSEKRLNACDPHTWGLSQECYGELRIQMVQRRFSQCHWAIEANDIIGACVEDPLPAFYGTGPVPGGVLSEATTQNVLRSWSILVYQAKKPWSKVKILSYSVIIWRVILKMTSKKSTNHGQALNLCPWFMMQPKVWTPNFGQFQNLRHQEVIDFPLNAQRRAWNDLLRDANYEYKNFGKAQNLE